MMASDHAYSAQIIDDIRKIGAVDWNACACPAGVPYNPFVSYTFLSALEASGCATAQTGWYPQHILLRDKAGHIAGVMPLYLKNHSYGEYVFDHAWADAYQRAGGAYYPKLQSAVPFTPVTGPRLMTHPDAHPDVSANIRRALVQAAVARSEELGISSMHLTFLQPADWDVAGSQGLLQRTDQQFHWENRGYGDFDDFLADLSSRKRKVIRKERRAALVDGMEIEILSGPDITEAHWDAYFGFYLDTGSRKWGRPYLNRQFFSLIGDSMASDIVLIMVRRDGRYIAGAMSLKGSDTLYGRYWGCVEDHRFLHFEVCYYQAIDYAIRHGLKRVEAGAQGEHKLARGYLPTKTLSAHWIRDPHFRTAVDRFLKQERSAVDHTIEILQNYAPFRHTPDND